MISSPIAVKVRNFTRKLGLNRFIANLLTSKEYEDKFGNAISSKIKLGDIVWDIGANRGIYTQIFLDRIGSQGKVVAFEPAPSCYSELQKKYESNSLVQLKNIAVGSSNTILSMNIEADPLAATHKIVDQNDINNDDSLIKVQVRSLDSLIESEADLIPNVIKIDVEGYEGQVLDGMKNLLTYKQIRCIGIEVHFGLLNERGEGNRPQQIEKALKENGFVVDWTDSSHIIATR
jgi:FkbM family methyltransferase